MPLSRRDVITRLAALTAMTAIPRSAWSLSGPAPDPLDGTIAEYLAGFHGGSWSAAEVTAAAIERCRSRGMALRAIDALSATALDDARAADARRRAGTLRGPLDGGPVFAKSSYDLKGLPTTAAGAEGARPLPGAGGGRAPARGDAARPARRRSRLRQVHLRHEGAPDDRLQCRVGTALSRRGGA